MDLNMDKMVGWDKDQTLRHQGRILGRDLVIAIGGIQNKGEEHMEGIILRDQAMGGSRAQEEDHMEGIMLRDHMGERGLDRRGEDTVDKEEETGHKWEGTFRGKIQTIGATQDKWGVPGWIGG